MKSTVLRLNEREIEVLQCALSVSSQKTPGGYHNPKLQDKLKRAAFACQYVKKRKVKHPRLVPKTHVLTAPDLMALEEDFAGQASKIKPPSLKFKAQR